MSTSKPRAEITFRILLTAVILFNALAPTISVAEAKQASASIIATRSLAVKQENSSIPIFERPKARVDEVSQSIESTALQTSDVLLQCDPTSSTLPQYYGSPICPNQSPAISLTETFSKDESIYNPAGGFARFRLLCQGGSCEPPDIYYQASMDATYHDKWGAVQTWGASLYVDAHFTTTLVQGMPNGVCGVAAWGSCHFDIAGVIPKEIISQNSGNYSASGVTKCGRNGEPAKASRRAASARTPFLRAVER